MSNFLLAHKIEFCEFKHGERQGGGKKRKQPRSGNPAGCVTLVYNLVYILNVEVSVVSH